MAGLTESGGAGNTDRSDGANGAVPTPTKPAASTKAPHYGRVARAAGQRRTPASAPQRPTPRAPIPLIENPSADGRLVLLTQAGATVHITPAPVAESLRYMLGRMRLGESGALPERLGVTAALSGEGTSFIARSLALVLAHDVAQQVCLVDLNWWAPSLWVADETPAEGIADVIRNSLSLADVIIPTGTPSLSILAAGATSASERPLLAYGPELEKVLVELSTIFDQVVIDLPAVRATSEALRLAELSRSVALVVRQGVTPESEVKSAVEELTGVSLLGVILNRSSSKVPRFIRNRIPGG
jgi:Mrp family chromosome partitioning ATPase